MSDKKILISQQQPKAASPYTTIEEKFGARFDFKPFFKIEPLTSREFRSQRINILDYTAIVFSARTTIDAFFQLCEELRRVEEVTVKSAILWLSAGIYGLFLIRKIQIFTSNCSVFTAFLYLCALEIIPTGTLVVSAIIL